MIFKSGKDFVEVSMKILQVLVLIFGLAIFANAQKAVLSGTLLDQAGAIFPFTTVQIKNAKGKIIQTKSDGEGKFAVKLPYGIFIISAESEVNSALYKSKEIKIEIRNSDQKRLDLTLLCTEGGKGKCPVVEIDHCSG